MEQTGLIDFLFGMDYNKDCKINNSG